MEIFENRSSKQMNELELQTSFDKDLEIIMDIILKCKSSTPEERKNLHYLFISSKDTDDSEKGSEITLLSYSNKDTTLSFIEAIIGIFNKKSNLFDKMILISYLNDLVSKLRNDLLEQLKDKE